MKFKFNTPRSSRWIVLVLSLAAILSAQAQNPVTFTVDMTSQPSAVDVYVRGSFNDWGTIHPLTNDGFGTYSTTVDIPGNAGDLHACKFFYQPGDNWEGDPNRQFVLTGGPQVLPLTAWNEKYPAPPNNVTFQVDMTAQILLGAFENESGTVRVSGVFNGWGEGDLLTNNPALSGDAVNVYSAVVPVDGFPGSTVAYKFRANGGWESPASTGGGDRTFEIAGGDQVLPLVYYSDIEPSTPTNNITFQVDMTAQVFLGNFDPSFQEVRVSGSFNDWGAGDLLTNNPALSGNDTNIYSAVIPIVASPGVVVPYKFRAPIGDSWENPTSTGGGNRTFTVAGGDQVLPLVFYNDASPCDLLQQDTLVTYWLRLPIGTVATDGMVYDGSQTVHINGDFNGWAGWDPLLPEMTPAGSNDLFSFTAVVTRGKAIAQKFKFSLSGFDNEAPMFDDHIKYIRTLGAEYTMPVAEFGTNYAALRVEQSFGDLKIGSPVGGDVPVTWLGRPCVTLQVRSTVDGGSWTDLPATESEHATNWPLSSGSSQFFRLYKRP
jgi:hypothetical protein